MEKVIASSHKIYPSIYRKIRWSFGGLTLLIFCLFWSLIYIAEDQLEVISLHHWLDTEASRYVINYQVNGEKTPLPNTYEFKSYWSKKSLPAWLKSYQTPGFYEHLLGKEDKHFIVIGHPSGKGLFYILFQDDADDYLDEYEDNLHYFTLILGGLITLAMALYGFYFVRALSHPLEKIEQKVSQMPPDMAMFEVETGYKETRKIERALLESKRDIALFFKREQEFSRFASHELRTPIMVVKGSTELLAKIPDIPRVGTKAIARLERAGNDMTLLTETFLLLGRQQIATQHFGYHSLEQLLRQQLKENAPLFAKQDVGYDLSAADSDDIYAPQSFITVIINNLIKNAFSYSVDNITVKLENNRLTISNRHDGNDLYQQGYGCGLVIIERICERMDWQFSINQTDTLFTAIVEFSSHNEDT